MNSELTGGQALVRSLISNGVHTVFGVPGVQLDHLFNALHDFRDEIRVVHCRHEAGAGYMALGYAAATGEPGVCAVVPGPGLLNASAALATAYAVNAPVLCLVGQIHSDAIGKDFGLLHELPDQLAVAAALTKWSALIGSPAEVPVRVSEGFRHLKEGCPGPVELEIAMDQLQRRQEVDLAAASEPSAVGGPDDQAIEDACQALASASNPLIVVGGGAVDAGPALRRVAELLQAPVTALRNGQGVLDSRHPLFVNQLAAHRYWETADVVLGVGTRLRQARQWGTDENMKIVRLDIDPGRLDSDQLGVLGDACASLPALGDALEGRLEPPRPSRTAELEALRSDIDDDLTTLEPQIAYLRAMREALPEDGIFVEDLTQVGYVARLAFPVYSPRTYITPGYQGTLGYGFPTALGVKVAQPDKKVLSISGDGGFMFCVGELATAAQHNIAVVAVVFTNDAYGNVQRMQREQHGGRVIATDLVNPDFVELAKTFGVNGCRAESPAELGEAIERAFEHDGPTVIEVPIGDFPDPWNLLLPPKIR